ncbi:MAG TPA: hypothetical protein VF384_10970 [Planctomycetota bacterium]
MKAPWLAAVLAAACASGPVSPPPFVEIPPAVAQDPASFAGFVAKNEQAEDPGSPWTVSGPHLRTAPQYVELVGDLDVHIGPTLTCSDYVATLQDLLERIEAKGFAARPEGKRALTILRALVGEERTRLAVHGDGPLAGARNDRVELLPGKAVDVADDLGFPNQSWVVTGFGGSDVPRIPMVAKTTIDARGTEVWRRFLDKDLAFCVATFFDFADRLQLATVDVDSAIVRLGQNAAAWQNYLQRGYPQYPWENFANGLLVSSAWDRAPRHQFVLLHPEPGIVFDVDRADSADLDLALLVHALGFLYYGGDDRGWFLGASATGALSEDEGDGFSYGLTLHAGFTNGDNPLPHVSVGLLWHEGVDDDGFQVSIGVDVLRLFGGK